MAWLAISVVERLAMLGERECTKSLFFMDNETKQVIIDISPLVISERFDIWYLLEVPVDPALVLEKYPPCNN